MADFLNSLFLRPVWREPFPSQVSKPVAEQTKVETKAEETVVRNDEPQPEQFSGVEEKPATPSPTSYGWFDNSVLDVAGIQTDPAQSRSGIVDIWQSPSRVAVPPGLALVSAYKHRFHEIEQNFGNDTRSRLLLSIALRHLESSWDRDTIIEKLDLPANAYENYLEGTTPTEGSSPNAGAVYLKLLEKIETNSGIVAPILASSLLGATTLSQENKRTVTNARENITTSRTSNSSFTRKQLKTRRNRKATLQGRIWKKQ